MLILKLREDAARALHERLDPLDAVDVLRERREHGGLIAAPGADLEHPRELLARRTPRSAPRSSARRCRAARSSGRSRSAAPCPRMRGSRAPRRRTGAAAPRASDRAPPDVLMPSALQPVDQPLARARGRHADAAALARSSEALEPAGELVERRVRGEVDLERRNRHEACRERRGNRCRVPRPGPRRRARSNRSAGCRDRAP